MLKISIRSGLRSLRSVTPEQKEDVLNAACCKRIERRDFVCVCGRNMTSLFKARFPFFETPLVGCLGLMDITVVRVFVLQALGLGLGVCGHFHVANLLPAVTYFLFRFVKDGILTMTINPVNEAFAIVRLGKLCRGFVQVFLATPFHVRILTRKSIQHQEKKHKRA